jgi:hypothetical protein
MTRNKYTPAIVFKLKNYENETTGSSDVTAAAAAAEAILK